MFVLASLSLARPAFHNTRCKEGRGMLVEAEHVMLIELVAMTTIKSFRYQCSASEFGVRGSHLPLNNAAPNIVMCLEEESWL